MKRMPAAVRELLVLMFVFALFLTAFAIAFPTSRV
jgi:hypothetical protein